jgi:hypothetical protein
MTTKTTKSGSTRRHRQWAVVPPTGAGLLSNGPGNTSGGPSAVGLNFVPDHDALNMITVAIPRQV